MLDDLTSADGNNVFNKDFGFEVSNGNEFDVMIAESSNVGVDSPKGIGRWCGAGDCSIVELGTPVPVPMFCGV